MQRGGSAAGCRGGLLRRRGYADSTLAAGAVTGGGLTVIANAPNPAGASILKERFSDGVINPLGLLLGALPPTLVAVMAFRVL